MRSARIKDRVKALTLCLLFGWAFVGEGTPQIRCGAAIDLFNQVREKLGPETTGTEAEDSLFLLKRSTSICINLGDAWYFRSKLEERLGQESKARYSSGKAKEYRSEALAVGLDPFTLSTGGIAEGAVSAEIGQKWALVIGVGEFQDASIPPLRFTAKDARDFAEVLQDPNFGRFDPGHVRVLTDSQATRRDIKASLNWLARVAGKDDMVVIFVSSHGSPREYDTAGVSYIVTHDTDASNQDQIYATALAMEDLSEAVRNRIQAQRAILLLDTCYSGSISASPQASGSTIGVSQRTLNRLGQGVGRVILTSSQADEQSWESADLRNSYFTYYLMEGLKLKNGLAEVGEVYHYVRQKVSLQVSEEKGASQIPVISRSPQIVPVQIGMPATGIGGAQQARR